ncbi:DUF6680 family protein [Psychrobacter sp. DAB_AL43B]|uniref:DUF6680 family protein n=1 Tax=Psychrobacter sp. DAB_AL43B TaxID=1028416 RepID=UPI0009A69A4D|nr:DUF6680 family protein [Psychrobacter sp. DAB_AL43B]SLJ84916.1 hypothetical protein DABAL43B_1721 [Psychrobacter sp. DAB_AL43B]
MDTTDIVTILAVLFSPILAVQAQKYIELAKESKNRKLQIFYILMSTRATRLTTEHVSALNMIDIEFYGKRFFGKRNQSEGEKKITNAWKLYNDHLNNNSPYGNPDIWNEEVDKLFNSLLYSIAKHLNYDFDEVQLKRDCYRPMGHENIEKSQLRILQGLVEVLDGEKAIPMTIESLSRKNN